jgi:hypothetical protein
LSNISVCCNSLRDRLAFQQLPEQLKKLFVMFCLESPNGHSQERSFFNGIVNASWIKHCESHVCRIQLKTCTLDEKKLSILVALLASNQATFYPQAIEFIRL